VRLLFKTFALPFYRIWALRHIRQSRAFCFEGLRVEVPPGVFHPGVFFSTPIFAAFLKNKDLSGKKTLDIGTGSGALALFAAQKGAEATALDISPVAVQTAQKNALANGLSIRFAVSDLLEGLPPEPFDVVLVNPPYYFKNPRDLKGHAFFAGENGTYFVRLFAQLPAFVHLGSEIWMILSEDSPIPSIRKMAERSGFSSEIVFGQKKWGEQFWVFEFRL
jgi:release factor glutamine methyltransferase